MKALSRKLLAFVSASLLISTTPGTAVAQSSLLGSSIRDEQQSKIQASETPPADNDFYLSNHRDTTSPQVVDGPFAQWGIPTPPGAEGYEVNQATNDELNPQGLKEWHPTTNPNSEVIPGQMRSDREEIPAGINKNEADKAEIREAQLANPDTPTLNARPGCKVYWPSPFEVCGLIKEKYDKVGGPTSFLLLPKSNELTNPDGIGKRSEFVNGYIYWHPKTGAHTVSLPAAKVWERHGWEKGFLGYPTTSDMALGNQWFKQDFQGGYVYTHNALPATQASIQGRIYDKWQSMGAQNSELGYPISDELTTPDGVGRYNVFERGMIYWTPQHGAHAVLGSILIKWGKSGFEKSSYGYPVEDPKGDDGFKITQKFQRGTLQGYKSPIPELAKILDLKDNQIDDLYTQLSEDFRSHQIPLRDGFQESYRRAKESLEFTTSTYNPAQNQINTYALNDASTPATSCDKSEFAPPGNERTNRGDVFYSKAVRARIINHGHTGIFVTQGNADPRKISTVEAVGADSGVQLLRGSERLGVCQPTYLSVNTDNSTRDQAASWAESKVGKGYEKNFATTRIGKIDRDSYNCSQLIWAAYKHASGGGLDIGERYAYEPYQPAVYPLDILLSHNTTAFN